MRCKCGNEIKNVPEHLRGLANWVCEECINTLPVQPVVEPTESLFKLSFQMSSRKEAA